MKRFDIDDAEQQNSSLIKFLFLTDRAHDTYKSALAQWILLVLKTVVDNSISIVPQKEWKQYHFWLLLLQQDETQNMWHSSQFHQ